MSWWADEIEPELAKVTEADILQYLAALEKAVASGPVRGEGSVEELGYEKSVLIAWVNAKRQTRPGDYEKRERDAIDSLRVKYEDGSETRGDYTELNDILRKVAADLRGGGGRDVRGR